MSTAAIEGSAAYYNMTRMGVRTVAKRIAKRTAKGLVKNTVLTGTAGMGTLVVVVITSTVTLSHCRLLACHQMHRPGPEARTLGYRCGKHTFMCICIVSSLLKSSCGCVDLPVGEGQGSSPLPRSLQQPTSTSCTGRWGTHVHLYLGHCNLSGPHPGTCRQMQSAAGSLVNARPEV